MTETLSFGIAILFAFWGGVLAGAWVVAFFTGATRP